MKKEEIIKKIEPEKIYGLKEIARNGLMGVNKTLYMCRKEITDELWLPKTNRILDAKKRGGGDRVFYEVKGQNLINYLTKH